MIEKEKIMILIDSLFVTSSNNISFSFDFLAPICRSCQSHDGTARSNRTNQECGSRPRQLELPKDEKDPYE